MAEDPIAQGVDWNLRKSKRLRLRLRLKMRLEVGGLRL